MFGMVDHVSMGNMRLIVASFNIYKKLSVERTLDDFRDVLAVPGLDVVGLQEIDWGIEHGHLPTGWLHHQPAPNSARKDPILWRNKYQVVDQGVRELHEPVGDAPRRHASWVAFEDFLWINCHLNADVEQPPGHPKRDSPRPEANHKMLLALIELADELQREHGVPAFISGDFNVDFGADKRVRHRWFPYANLTRAGFVCCWEGRKEESTRTAKPNKGRTIDQIWARGTKTHRVVFRHAFTPNRWSKGDPVESDHLAVIALAVIKRRLFPWLFSLIGRRKRGR